MGLTELFVILWVNRKWIAVGTLLAFLVGCAYAFMTPPVYFSSATLAMKESEKNPSAANMLSQFGGFGGVVAAQLGLGTTNLAKIEVLLNTKEMAESVVTKHDMLPKIFPSKWNAAAQVWTDSLSPPTLKDGIKALRSGQMSVKIDEKRKMIIVGAFSEDREAAKSIVDAYLKELNEKLLGDLKNEAMQNQDYLNAQLTKTSDPVLREKIIAMIASEIEKYMLVSTRSFEILSPAEVPEFREKPKRKIIVALSIIVGLVGTVALILAFPTLSLLIKQLKEAKTLST